MASVIFHFLHACVCGSLTHECMELRCVICSTLCSVLSCVSDRPNVRVLVRPRSTVCTHAYVRICELLCYAIGFPYSILKTLNPKLRSFTLSLFSSFSLLSLLLFQSIYLFHCYILSIRRITHGNCWLHLWFCDTILACARAAINSVFVFLFPFSSLFMHTLAILNVSLSSTNENLH